MIKIWSKTRFLGKISINQISFLPDMISRYLVLLFEKALLVCSKNKKKQKTKHVALLIVLPKKKNRMYMCYVFYKKIEIHG